MLKDTTTAPEGNVAFINIQCNMKSVFEKIETIISSNEIRDCLDFFGTPMALKTWLKLRDFSKSTGVGRSISKCGG